MDVTQETATVSQIEGDYAYLQPSTTSGCGQCSLKSSCGNFNFFESSPSLLQVRNTLDLKVGDTVVLGIPSHSLILSVMILYLLPLFSLLLLAVIGKAVGDELGSILLGLLGLGLGILLTKKIVSNSSIKTQLKPTVLRKIIGINVSH